MSAILKAIEAADQHFLTEARRVISERLKDGHTVGRCSIRDLLDIDLNHPDRYKIIVEDLGDLLLQRGTLSRDEIAERIMDDLIDRFLNSDLGQIEIEEEAARLEADE